MNNLNEEKMHILFSCSHDELLQTRYELTEQSLKELEEEPIPAESFQAFKTLEDREFPGKPQFLNAVEQDIGKEQTKKYQELILKHAECQYPLLLRMLNDWGYTTDFVDKLTFEKLKESHILVLGAPKGDLQPEETRSILQFVKEGGGLLLLCNSEILINPLRHEKLHALTADMGLKLQEYHNYPPTYIQVFRPHYMTANIKRLQVQRVASVSVTNTNAYPIAFTKTTKEPVAVCAEEIGSGRIVAVGDVAIFSDALLKAESNETFVKNTFFWLSACNAIDIKELHISKAVNLGEEGTVELVLQNNHRNPDVRPDVECTLVSDAGAIIAEPIRQEKPSIPPGKKSLIKWSSVKPQKLGEQQLRLIVNISNPDEPQSLRFDQLPEEKEMYCMAPGYLTLEIRGKEGNLKATVREGDHKLKMIFKTGEYFTIEGAFHWSSDSKHKDDYHLELKLADGLIETGKEIESSEKVVWYVKAVAPGTHEITLRIIETGQELPALVTVTSSTKDQIAELYAAYVYPLDAEIAERLRQVDRQLSCLEIKEQPFKILSPEDFVRKIYKEGEAASWLQGVLVSANREQWYNPDLLDLVLTYIAPTYLANVGSFIPYDPYLASHLAELHPSDKKSLEYNLLWAEENSNIRENINIRQNIAAYLLHEKYGHGFFYTQTHLGQQLSILLRHGFPEKPDEEQYKDYKKLTELIKDSAFVVNEGFAAWMELTFLEKLDREVQQAVYPRRVHLIQEASGLYQRRSEFFELFPPRYDSPYREGFEYLEFIGKTFNLRCAVQLFLFATQIEFGITENAQGKIQFAFGPNELKKKLDKANELEWCSHLRLQKITDLLYEHQDRAITLVRNQNCPGDCLKSDDCPLKTIIAEHFYGGFNNERF